MLTVATFTANAAPTGLRPNELGGSVYFFGADFYHVALLPDGATGSLEPDPPVGASLITGDVGPALYYKGGAWTLNVAFAASPALIDGLNVAQVFTGQGSFSFQLSGVSKNFLTGSVSGGAVRGQIGASGVSITLDIDGLRSDILGLSGRASTLTMSGESNAPLSLICNAPDSQVVCPAGFGYLADFGWNVVPAQVKWFIPGATFAAVVPEPSSWQLLLGGLTVAGLARLASRAGRQSPC